MADHGIIFSAPMVRALIAGTKTQTRRLASSPLRRVRPGDRLWVRETHAYVGSMDPGWLLYRASGYEWECRRHGFDEPYPPESSVRWTPAIHMKRTASRLTLICTDTKIEPLQAISEADCRAEGIERSDADPLLWRNYAFASNLRGTSSPQISYRSLWDSLHGAPVPVLDDQKRKIGTEPNPARWEANPDVLALSFIVEARNIDRAS